MASLNRVILMGNLTRDPELRQTPSGTAVAEFGLALNRTWKGQDGNRQEETTFVEITTFAKTAELVKNYLSKGRRVLVEGRLKYDQWTSPDGSKRSKLTVVAENVTFLDSSRDGAGPGGGGGGMGGGGSGAPRRNTNNDRGNNDYGGYDQGGDDGGSDHIPF